MDKLHIVIEAQTICRCGKSIIPMNEKEREEYDIAVREIEKRSLQHAKPIGDEAVERRE